MNFEVIIWQISSCENVFYPYNRQALAGDKFKYRYQPAANVSVSVQHKFYLLINSFIRLWSVRVICHCCHMFEFVFNFCVFMFWMLAMLLQSYINKNFEINFDVW